MAKKRIEKKKLLIGVSVVILTAAAGTGIYFMGNQEKTAEKELAYVSRVSSMDPFSGIQRMAGVVEPQKTWEVQKNPEREVKEILVKTGDEVRVGTALFIYDTEQLESDLEQALLELERFDGNMENLKTQIAQLEKEKKKASEDEQFSYTTEIQTAQMDLKKAEYEKKAKEVEITQMREKMSNSTVTSEMDGVVKNINETNEIDPYSGNVQAFMTILATGDYRIKGKVNEQNLYEIQEGERAIIRSRVDETKTWMGTFSAVDTEKAETTNNNMYYGNGDSGDTTSTSYPFYVNLDSSQDLLLGQHVYIERDMGVEEKEGLWLAEGYIADLDTEPYVWVESKEGKLEKRAVTLGAYDEEMFRYQIEEGLDANDYVAFPQEFLKEGMKTTHEEVPVLYEENGMEGAIEEGEIIDGEMPEDAMDGEAYE
ncbi:MAG: efflux RND transporter periplasmic adaptor subunit [Blautia sp.]